MRPKLFDTHTHFNFNAFRDDWREVIERTLAQNVWFINVGTEAKTSRRAADIAGKYPLGVYASVGLHPIHTYDDEHEETVNGEKVKFAAKAEEFNKKFYKALVEENNKVAAIGETGLDYFHIKKFSPALRKKLKLKQIEVFRAQIELASELGKPIIIHCRSDKDFDAHREILEILKNYPVDSGRRPESTKGDSKHMDSHLSSTVMVPDPRGNDDTIDRISGIVHCFQANAKILEKFLQLGFYIGYNGVITFTNQYNELVRATPLEKIVLETDSPWLAPAPHRGQRNESIYVELVAKRIAELKGTTYEEVAVVATDNAMKIFDIKNI